jgi:hypothetical protein
MGIFSRRAAPAAGWYAEGAAEPGGWIGGDIQRGDSYDVRFVRDDKPGSMITVSFYAVEYDECPGEFAVQRQVEWLVCEDPADPGGTEIWSDYSYDDISAVVMDAEDEAERDARECADAAVNDDSYFGWDGEPA